MAKTSIGPLKLNAFGDSISLESIDQPDFFISLDSSEINELIDYLILNASTEFNQRKSFRLPMWSTSGLRVSIQKDGKGYRADARNISLAGLLVELQHVGPLDFSIGTNVHVTLELEGNSQTHLAIVCRRKGRRCGLFFPEALTGDEIEPPAEYLQLVMELQRRLMAHRKKNKTDGPQQ